MTLDDATTGLEKTLKLEREIRAGIEESIKLIAKIENSIEGSQQAQMRIKDEIKQVKILRPWSSFKNTIMNLASILPLGIPLLYKFLFSNPQQIRQLREELKNRERQESLLLDEKDITLSVIHDLSNQSEKIEAYTQEISKLKEQSLNVYQEIVESTSHYIRQLRDVDLSKDKVHNVLEQQKKIQNEMDGLERESDSHEKEINEWTTLIEEHQVKKNQALEAMKVHQSEIENLHDSAGEKKAPLSKLKAQEEEMKDQLLQHEKNLEQASHELHQLDHEIEKKSNQFIKLNQNRNEVSQKLSEFKAHFLDRLIDQGLGERFIDVSQGIPSDLKDMDQLVMINENADQFLADLESSEHERLLPNTPTSDLEEVSGASTTRYMSEVEDSTVISTHRSSSITESQSSAVISPPTLGMDKKINDASLVLNEIGSSEKSFLKQAQAFLERLSYFKGHKYGNDPFIQKFHEKVEKGVRDIQAFYEKLSTSLNEDTFEGKVRSIERCYSSKEFQNYVESMITFSTLDLELKGLVSDKKVDYVVPNPQYDPKDAFSAKDWRIPDTKVSSIIFVQWMPRHILLLKELNKHLNVETRVSTINVETEAMKINDAAFHKEVFIDMEKAHRFGFSPSKNLSTIC